MNNCAAVLSQMAAVIVAAGHGSLRSDENGRPVSKLLEKLGEKFVLQWVVEEAKKAGFGRVIVVLNDQFGRQIREALEAAGHTDLLYAHQKARRGPANAVFRALPVLREHGILDFVVAFGDMPFGSAKSMRCLAYHHVTKNAPFGFSSWEYDPRHPLAVKMNNYAYLCGEDLTMVVIYRGFPLVGSEVLSSLYAFNTEWFLGAYRGLKPYNKGDGYASEYHLPKMIEIEYLVSPLKTKPVKMREEPERIIGVNTIADLELVQALMQQQSSEGKP